MGEVLVKSLQNTKYSIDEKLEKSFITLFGQKPYMLTEAGIDANLRQEAYEQNKKIEPVEQYQSGKSMEDDVSVEEYDSEDLDNLGSSDQDDPAQKDDVSDTENDDASEKQATVKGHLKEHVELHAGRLRRKAVFGDDNDDNNMKVKKRLAMFVG